MFFRRMRQGAREEGDSSDDSSRFINSIIPKRMKPGGGRVLKSFIPKGGLLPRKINKAEKPAVREHGEEYESGGEGEGDQVSQYIAHLEKALSLAPCHGCRKLVKSALGGAAVFQKMQETGRSVKDISQEEIESIKKEIEEKYG